jgi:septum formation inhibitor MinC
MTLDKTEVDQMADRLERLISDAHAAFSRGDVETSLRLLAKAKAVAAQLPKKKETHDGP